MAIWPLNYIFRPTRKAGIVLAVLIFSLIAATLYLRSENGQKYLLGKFLASSAKKRAETKFLMPNQDLKLLEDSDEDGLQDWEETIYGTDPKNPDSDGDGTKDGEEIRAQRNPLLAGPNDLSPEPEKRITSAGAGGPHEENMTENLSQIFLQEYLSRKNSGESLDPQLFSEDLTGRFLEGKTSELDFPSVKETELKVSANNSPEAIRNYLNAIASIAQKNLSGLPDPFFIFAESIRAGDVTLLNDPVFSAELTRFDPMLASYEKTVRELKETAAPKIFAELHKNVIDLVLREHFMLQSFRDADQDIIKSLMMIHAREDTMLELQKYLAEVKLKLQESKTTFNSADPAKTVFGL